MKEFTLNFGNRSEWDQSIISNLNRNGSKIAEETGIGIYGPTTQVSGNTQLCISTPLKDTFISISIEATAKDHYNV